MRVRALSSSGDMTFGNGSGNFLVNSAAAVAQNVSTRLQLLTGQWFLDLTAGVPWTPDIIGFNTLGMADRTIQSVILGTPGVLSITNYSSSVNPKRLYSVNCDVTTIYGPAPPIAFVYSPPAPLPIFYNDGGTLALTFDGLYPTNTDGLSDGAVWSNGLSVCVVPGVSPNPNAPPVFYPAETPLELLILGGGNLPLSPTLGAGSGQLWNLRGQVCIA